MANGNLKAIGKSAPIREARNKVTGRAEFVDDMAAELYVKVLGSPHPHATIENIDTIDSCIKNVLSSFQEAIGHAALWKSRRTGTAAQPRH